MSKYIVDISSYAQFRTITIGKLFDVDGVYGAQCWDAAALLWSQPPMSRTLRSSNGSALGCWDSSVRQINAGTEFDIITDFTKIKCGDIIVFGTGLGSYGHIGFADVDYNDDLIACYSQNQGGSNGQGQAAAFSVKNYASRHLIGAFRFKAWNSELTPSSTSSIKESSTMKKISIEVGHGGNDPGAVNGSIREKDITLAVSLELCDILKRHGLDVLMSRTTDTANPIRNAGGFLERATAYKPDIGIAVHVNAGGGNGFEVFRKAGTSYTAKSNDLCGKITEEVRAIGQAIRSGCPKDSQFAMDSLPCPTAYLELGFLDNPVDYARFDTVTKQKKFAEAYAKGILKYFGITYVMGASTSESNTALAAPALPTTPSATQSDQLYRVQIGAYKEKANADKLESVLKNKGYDAFIRLDNGFYKVQVGAYMYKDNAHAALNAMKAAGYKDAYITTNSASSSTSSSLKKTNDEIAREVLRGDWGNDQERIDRLTAAGYDSKAIQAIVNSLL